MRDCSIDIKLLGIAQQLSGKFLKAESESIMQWKPEHERYRKCSPKSGMRAMRIERRRHKRFSIDELTFLIFRPEFQHLGKIKDISEGGVSFERLDLDEECEHQLDGEIDIFSSGGSFYASGIQCETVWEIDILENSAFLFNLHVGRYCGLKFVKLTEEQKSQINSLLRSHEESLEEQCS